MREYGERASLTGHYREAYRRYCWPVHSVSNLKLAPFHILATESAVHVNRTHIWHMEMIGKIVASGESLLQETRYCRVRLSDEASEAKGIAWWSDCGSATSR
jgi:protein phosphatase